MNDQLELQKRLIRLTQRFFDQYHECGKPDEPSLSISVENDLTWCAEIYSYVLSFDDGTRHHFFEAKTYPELIHILDDAITREEQKWR